TTYTRLAAEYSAKHPDVQVKVEPFATHAQAVAAVQAATNRGDPPDLFEIDGEDLPGLVEDKAVQRVDELLTDRQVDFGDGFSRSALEAFSADSALWCMPTDASPLVVYYNTRLIDLSLAAAPDRRPVTQETGWTLDEFARVAGLAKRATVRGLYVAPDLRQVAPFIWSGGGDLVDSPDNPTTLALSEDSSAAAMQQFLAVARDRELTFDASALRRQSAVERFKAGKLGMMLGYRDLTPVLRAQRGLNFDVMPLPRAGGAATDASMRGMCLSSGSHHLSQAADLLTYLVSDSSTAKLAATGYVMPTNVDALNGDAFLQQGQRPLHADVFEREMRHVEELPRSRYWPDVARTTAGPLYQLLYDPVIVPLSNRLTAIDDASKPLFNPNATASPSPSGSPSGSATPSASPTPSG
ncbi:MAG: extracellular solute-binding protein, partial [Marmoricola sp.]|nr:extracellular solute-binding protein [Marmoricola sp.]